MRTRILASFTLAFAGAVALNGAQSGSSTPPQQEQRPPTFRTEANYVRVDAYPTRNGEAVQDLTAADFEILEDGKPQSIEQFERVVVSPAGPQSLRAEPNTIGESKQLMANPRNRVFVLFLDVQNVSVEGSWHAREPLIRLLDRVLGPDDLVGVMTTRMSAADVVLARKTEVIASGLRALWPWGERHTIQQDDKERQYEACYTELALRPVVAEMIARKRERQALEALNELVLYLRDVREERKAILTVSEGWVLFRENRDLTRPRVISATTGQTEPVPGPDPIGVGPDGRLTLHNRRSVYSSSDISKEECDRDRLSLSLIDDDRYLRDNVIGEANRANASFYTIDPRGLPVFDTPLGPEAPLGVIADAAVLHRRLDTLRMLAENTDGMAVLNSNDLDPGLKKIASDLSSYYLLGYYSSSAKLDGKYHAIKVRVKRPGVDVRARKGYTSPTEEEVVAAKRAAATPVPPAAAAVNSAMAALSRLRPDTRFSMNAVPIAAGPARTVSTIWIAGELPASEASNPWSKGGTVSLDVKAGGTSTTARVTLAAGQRTFAIPVTLPSPVQNGSLDVRATLTGADPDAARFADTLTLDLQSASTQPMLYRRGPATGNRLLPGASFQFSRTERAHLEFPVESDAKPASARLLDKTGQPLAIPVVTGERTDAPSGQRWLTADVVLAPLGAGDYVIEVAMTTGGAEHKVVTAIRVGR